MIYDYTLGNGVKVFSDETNSQEFILADDYTDLKQDYDDLQNKYDKLMEKIGDIWREN